MDGNCNLTAGGWIVKGKDEMIQIDLLKDCWPWASLTPDEWVDVNKRLTSSRRVESNALLSLLFICPVGIVGSLLCAIAVLRKVLQKERFYQWMFAISLLDFLFNVLVTYRVLAYGRVFPNLKNYDYFNIEFLSRSEGLIAGLSLAVDLCALCLTIERFWIFRNTIEQKLSVIFTILQISIVVVFASARCLVYAAEYIVVDKGNGTYDLAANNELAKSAWWNNLALVTANILPFVLLFSMICFSLGIAIIVFKRRVSPLFQNTSPQQQDEIQKQSRSIIRLCFALSFLFVCNQLGYCLNVIAFKVFQKLVFDFTSSYSDMVYVSRVIYIFAVSALLCAVLECLSKTLNFFIYFLLNRSFRDEFRNSCRRLTCRST